MRFKRSLPKKPALLLELALRYLKAFKSLGLFQIQSGKVPSLETLEAIIYRFQALMDAARNLDRVQVALRNKMQVELGATLKRMIHFVEATADDDDLLALQQAGIELCRSTWKKTTRPASQAKEATAGEENVMVQPAGT